jgi:hypothetical protein
MYEFVKRLNDRQVLVKKTSECFDDYFVVSFANVPFSGPEVLVFPAASDGKIIDWGEVDGGRDYSSLEMFLAEKVQGVMQ